MKDFSRSSWYQTPVTPLAHSYDYIVDQERKFKTMCRIQNPRYKNITEI